MSEGRSRRVAQPVGHSASRTELLVSLIRERRLSAVVPTVLDILERDDPLASAGQFPGDLLRGLMEVPGHFWGRHPPMYERYRAALRAGAAARRHLPPEERLRFWRPLAAPSGSAEGE